MLYDDFYYLGMMELLTSKKKDAKKMSRDEIITIGKEKFFPLIDEDREVIKRKDWDLHGLDIDLFHSHFDVCKNHFFKNFVPSSDTAVLICSTSSKPWESNPLIKKFIKHTKDKADILIVGRFGVVPIIYSKFYPFMWCNGSFLFAENDERIPLYVNKITRSIIEWFHKFVKYERIISLIPPGDVHKAFKLSKVTQKKFDVFSDITWNILVDEYLEKVFDGNVGLFKARILQLKKVEEVFLQLLEKE
jgi:hypothetical protein